jgi:hypothetical protein
MDKPKEEEMYRVRTTWEDAKSQIGAYRNLDSAKALADSNDGYNVFNSKGELIYAHVAKPVEPPVNVPPPVVEIPIPEPPKHVVMGVAECTVEQCETYLHKTNPNAPYYADIYKEQCEAEGVRFDFAFAQSIIETGFFRFTGDVVPEQNNFAGIGTVGGGVKGNYFATPQEGILAQAQHLKAYASTDPLNKPCVDPRFSLVTRGKAPCIEDFGNGVWAASKDNYGGRIYGIAEAIKATVADPQYKKPEPIPEPKPEPIPEEKPVEAPQPNEGNALLDLLLEVLRKFFEYILKNI